MHTAHLFSAAALALAALAPAAALPAADGADVDAGSAPAGADAELMHLFHACEHPDFKGHCHDWWGRPSSFDDCWPIKGGLDRRISSIQTGAKCLEFHEGYFCTRVLEKLGTFTTIRKLSSVSDDRIGSYRVTKNCGL